MGMTNLKRTALVALLASLAVACGSESDDNGAGDTGGGQVSQDNLAGRDFVATDITVDDEPYQLADRSTIVIGFKDGQVTANAGCNSLFGSATWDDGTLNVDNLGGTEMGCDQALMDQDVWLSELLSSQPTLEVDGDTVTLTSGTTVITLTDKSVVQPDVVLEGTAWTLESMGSAGSDGAVSSVPSDVTSTLTINAEGQLELAPGCNTGGAAAEVADGTITFGPVRLTKMACEGSANEVERAVLAVVDGEVGYAIKGDQLTLTKGDTMLVYRADA